MRLFAFVYRIWKFYTLLLAELQYVQYIIMLNWKPEYLVGLTAYFSVWNLWLIDLSDYQLLQMDATGLEVDCSNTDLDQMDYIMTTNIPPSPVGHTDEARIQDNP